MKKNIFKILGLALSISIALFSCDLEEDGFDSPSSNPVIESITPVQGESNVMITLLGSGMGDIRSVVFTTDSVDAVINPTLNTDGSFLFRVPEEAIPGAQQIVLTNSLGVEFSTDFFVLGYPVVESVSNYNFDAGDQITLVGKNLLTVDEVTLAGSGETATVISTTETTVTIEMPATTEKVTQLTLVNESGAATPMQEFVHRSQQFLVFTDDYEQTFVDASWAPSAISTDTYKSGTASISLVYPAGWWTLLGFGWDNIQNEGFEYLSFWVYGSATHDLYIQSAASPSAWDTFQEYNKITPEANQWTYYKISVDDLQLWANATEWNQFAFRIQGPEDADVTFYFDDIMFIYE